MDANVHSIKINVNSNCCALYKHKDKLLKRLLIIYTMFVRTIDKFQLGREAIIEDNLAFANIECLTSAKN